MNCWLIIKVVIVIYGVHQWCSLPSLPLHGHQLWARSCTRKYILYHTQQYLEVSVMSSYSEQEMYIHAVHKCKMLLYIHIYIPSAFFHNLVLQSRWLLHKVRVIGSRLYKHTYLITVYIIFNIRKLLNECPHHEYL